MNTADIDTKLTDSYLALLKNMSTRHKLNLISRLSQSVKHKSRVDQTDFYTAFVGWDEDESAEELIRIIKGSRTFNRNIAEF